MNDESLLSMLEQPAEKPRSVPALVRELKQADQDHEFYPTTDAIIDALCRQIGLAGKDSHGNYHGNRHKYKSILDIGAGNGKVLKAVKSRCGVPEMHAIEKSSILCAELDPDILVVGTLFEEQSLLSKVVDVIFCNPPYSQFEDWAEKIIREGASKVVYLVIPQRWEKSTRIADAAKFRNATIRKIGDFDFDDAEDRTARAKVHLLKIDLGGDKWGSDPAKDAFQCFFEEQFADLINKFEEQKKEESPEGDDKKAKRPYYNLVVGQNYPDALVSIYNQEMAHIQSNYHIIGQLDADLLREFEINPKRIMELLKNRLSGLKNEYWDELFSKMNAITNRLTSKTRKQMLETMSRHVTVDFTVTNILEIVVWAIKNANKYMESQLIDTYELMVDKCNVQLYKSNKRVWVDQRWRPRDDADPNSHFALDYRIVTHQIGGIDSCSWRQSNSLSGPASDFIGDLMTIARNLGFVSDDSQRECLSKYTSRDDCKWKSGEKREFFYTKKGGKRELLFDVRAFQNGNLHLRLNKDFILALNVEHGRLKGWLRTPKEASEELQDPKAAQFFKSNLQLCAGNPAMMLGAGSLEVAA